jgi:hypothetical protein
MFLKSATKYAFAGKPGVEADVFYRKFGILQQIFGCIEPGVDDVLMGGKTGFFFKSSDKMIDT